MNITPQQFGMNFTTIRLKDRELSVYGRTSPETQDTEHIEEIQVVAFRPGEAGDAIFTRLEDPELEWSMTWEGPSDYELGQEVYVVGLAIRREKEPVAWRNLLKVKADTDAFGPTSPTAADAG